MIVVKDLKKSFGVVQALRGLSFSAEDGQITGLVGHNGAGKTTTFRVLAGLLVPNQGTALVDEWDVAAARVEAQRHLGVLPDVRGLYPRLTAREHIQYFGRLYGLDEDEIAAREDILINHLGMAEYADRPTKGFSRGQRLKVALAQCLVHNPRNIIFDEPTSGLDIASIKAMHDLILELKSLGTCVLISSHIISEIAKLCDQIVIIAEGRDLMAGTPKELADKGGRGDLETLFLQATARSNLKAVSAP